MSGFLENRVEDDVMSEINMTPLIDVMLVLLIIFIITLPVMNHALKLDLPKAVATNDTSHSENIDVSIDGSGQILWNSVPVDDRGLAARIAQAATAATGVSGATAASQPVIRIYADRTVHYDRVAHVLSAVQAGGLSRIDFVTDAPAAVPAVAPGGAPAAAPAAGTPGRQ